MELCPGMDDETVQNLQVRTITRNNVGVFEHGACYCQPEGEEQMNPSADNWKKSHVCKPWSPWGTPTTPIPAGHNTAGHKWSERFLEHKDGDFLRRVVEEPRKGDTDRPDTYQHEGCGRAWLQWLWAVEFRVLRGGRSAKISITILNFRTDFVLFKDLFGRIPWDMALTWP